MNIFFRWDNTNHALTDFIDVDAVDKPSLIAPMTTTSSRPIGGTDIRKFDIYLGGRRNLGGMGADEGGGHSLFMHTRVPNTGMILKHLLI